MARLRSEVEDLNYPLGKPARERKTPEQIALRSVVVASFLAIEATRHGWDCLILERPILCRLLSVQRISTQRLDQFLAAIPRWFSSHQTFFQTDSPRSVHSLVLANQPMSMEGNRTTPERLSELRGQGLRVVQYSILADDVDFTAGLEVVIDELRAIAANR